MQKQSRRSWALLTIGAVLSFGTTAQTTSSADAAIAVAQRWLAVAGAGEAAVMWEQSAPLMKTRESQSFWINYIAAARNALGVPMDQKIWMSIQREIDNPTLPPGEFVSVLFISSFSKTKAWEKVSLFKDRDQWVPTGYQYGAIDAPSVVSQ